MADENEVKALIARFWDVRQKLTADTPETKFWAIVAREALRWRDETRPPPAGLAVVPDAAALAARLDKMLGCHADSMPKAAYFEVDAVMRALKQAPPAAVGVPTEDAALDAAQGEVVAGHVQCGSVAIPFWVIDYAQKIELFMKVNGVDAWALGGIQSRDLPPPKAPPAAVPVRGADGGFGWIGSSHGAMTARDAPQAPPAAAVQGWSGWATQYPGKMPKLYGAEEIARLNWCPQEGADLVRVVEVDRVKASDWAGNKNKETDTWCDS